MTTLRQHWKNWKPRTSCTGKRPPWTSLNHIFLRIFLSVVAALARNAQLSTTWTRWLPAPRAVFSVLVAPHLCAPSAALLTPSSPVQSTAPFPRTSAPSRTSCSSPRPRRRATQGARRATGSWSAPRAAATWCAAADTISPTERSGSRAYQQRHRDRASLPSAPSLHALLLWRKRQSVSTSGSRTTLQSRARCCATCAASPSAATRLPAASATAAHAPPARRRCHKCVQMHEIESISTSDTSFPVVYGISA